MSGGANIFNINPIYTLPIEEVIYDSNSEVDFNVKPLQSAPALLRITENLQVSANIVPLHLTDVFYLPPAKKNEKKLPPKNNNRRNNHYWWVSPTFVYRDVRSYTEKWKKHREEKQKQQITSKKAKDKQEQPIKATKSKRNLIKESDYESEEEESKTNERTEKQPQRKLVQKASGLKFQKNLKNMSKYDEESSEDRNSGSDSEDFEGYCLIYSSEYLVYNPSLKSSSKKVDSWVQCDICNGWFHQTCPERDIGMDEDFVCDSCI